MLVLWQEFWVHRKWWRPKHGSGSQRLLVQYYLPLKIHPLRWDRSSNILCIVRLFLLYEGFSFRLDHRSVKWMIHFHDWLLYSYYNLFVRYEKNQANTKVINVLVLYDIIRREENWRIYQGQQNHSHGIKSNQRSRWAWAILHPSQKRSSSQPSLDNVDWERFCGSNFHSAQHQTGETLRPSVRTVHF
jgi:hypothetical protein